MIELSAFGDPEQDFHGAMQAAADTAVDPVYIPPGTWTLAAPIILSRPVEFFAGLHTMIHHANGVFHANFGSGGFSVRGIRALYSGGLSRPNTMATVTAGSLDVSFADPVFSPGDVILIRGCGVQGLNGRQHDHAVRIRADGKMNEKPKVSGTFYAELYPCVLYSQAFGFAKIDWAERGGAALFLHAGNDIFEDYTAVTNANDFQCEWLFSRLQLNGIRTRGNDTNACDIHHSVLDTETNSTYPNYGVEDLSFLGNFFYGAQMHNPPDYRTLDWAGKQTVINGGYSEHNANDLGASTILMPGTSGGAYMPSGASAIRHSQGTIHQSKTLFHGADFKVSVGELPSKPIRLDFTGQGGTWDWAYGRSFQGHGEPGWMGWYKGNSPRNAAILENEAGEPLLVRGGYWIAKVPGSLVEGNRLWRGVGTGPPTGPSLRSNGLWMQGDKIENSNPGPGAPAYWLCVGQGNPGTWEARQ